MWKYPWRYREGFAIVAGLFVTGILLQFTVGNIGYDFLKFPVNIISGLFFIVLIVVLYILSIRKKTLQWFSGMEASITAIAAFLFVVVLMGFTRQLTTMPSNPDLIDRLGFSQMLSAWPFVFLFLYLVLVLGLVTLRRITHFNLKNDIPFVLNHLGLLVALLAGVLGSADMQRLKMIVKPETPEWRATDKNGNVVELDIAVELRAFNIDEYPPKLLIIDNSSGKTLPEKNPHELLVEKENQTGKLLDWEVEVTKLFESSAPVLGIDTVKYTEYHSMGAVTAVYAKAKNHKTGELTEGWISHSTFVFPYKALVLNKNFSIVMPPREPRKFSSDVVVFTKSGKTVHTAIEVNKPLKIEGWKIYQYSYDENKGKWSEISLLELVKDPWLWLVYAGIFMMMAGAVCLFTIPRNRPTEQ